MSKSHLAEEIGRNLLAARERLHLSQEDVARQIPTSQQNYQKWETGRALIGLEHFLKLPSILHCTVTDLLPTSLVTTRDRQYAKDPNLQRIIDLWPDLPEYLRDGLTAMADNYDRQKEGH